jgi:hypothetical protein
VLKQRSRQLEWFYRSVAPGVHYLPVLEANRSDVVQQVEWAEAHQPEARAMVDRANRFALTYTTYYARLVYWVYALHAYRGLFDDQDYYFETRGAEVRDLLQAHHRRREGAAAAKAAAALKAAAAAKAKAKSAGAAGLGQAASARGGSSTRARSSDAHG